MDSPVESQHRSRILFRRRRSDVKALHPLLQVWTDQPITHGDEDCLGFSAYADALAEVIDSPTTESPLTLSIDGPWGAGKTSLARLIEHRLREWPEARGDRPHIICWFNAWLHSDAPKLGPALAAAVARTVNGHRSLPRRLLNPLPSSMLTPQERWQRRLKIGGVALVGALFVLVMRHLNLHKLEHLRLTALGWEQVKGTLRNKGKKATSALLLGLLAAWPLFVALWSRMFSVAQAAATFIDDPKSQAASGSMADVAEQLGSLVRSTTRGKRRLVIFVDDLERCPGDRAVEICETATLLLAHPGVITILIGDLLGLRTFAEGRFRPAAEHGFVGA